jgi:glutathione synthase/RimK-type ligase-like ATP-grasp enzyme
MRAALVKDRNGFWELYKPLLEKYNIEVSLFDLRFHEDQNNLLKENWDFFIWRAKHTPKERNPAKRFINLMDSLGVKCYPDWKSFSLFDDKIEQSYLLQQKKIPAPETFVFYNLEDSLKFIEKTTFPIIYKSAHGAGSSNVGMLPNYKKASKYLKKVFGKGIKTFFASDYQKDYAYFQEFIKDNKGDFRIVCYADRVEGFFRNNRKDKPFASGSYDFDLKELPVDLLDFVYKSHEKLGYNVMSYDLLKDNDQWLVTEISVVYGDLKDEIYNKALQYRKTKDSWEKIEDPVNHHERVFETIVKKWLNHD